MSCSTVTTTASAPPLRPTLNWRDEGERLSLSKADAIDLARYLIEVDAYIKKTQ